MARNFNKLKKEMKPGNLRKARAKAKTMTDEMQLAEISKFDDTKHNGKANK
jgi:hypothetical protein